VGALLDGGHGWSWGLLLALAIAGFVLLVERSRGVTPAAGSWAPLDPPAAPTTDPTSSTDMEAHVTAPFPPAAPPGWAPLPAVPARRRERSALLGLTLSATLVALGLLAAVDFAGAAVPGGAYWATALAVVGLGLVVGSWLGRSRWLIALGVVLAVGTGASLAVERVPDGVDVRRTLTSMPASGISSEYSTGSVRYDLTGVDFAGLDTSLKVDLGAGEIVVVVPSDVDVVADASTGVGEVTVLGTREDGFGNEVHVNNVGADGPGGGALRVELSSGLGTVEVRRG
jgi:hypothetical protein